MAPLDSPADNVAGFWRRLSRLPAEFTAHTWDSGASAELFYARPLKCVNAMQTRAFQPIKSRVLRGSTLEQHTLINIICMLICIFLISDIIYAHNFRLLVPRLKRIN